MGSVPSGGRGDGRPKASGRNGDRWRDHERMQWSPHRAAAVTSGRERVIRGAGRLALVLLGVAILVVVVAIATDRAGDAPPSSTRGSGVSTTVRRDVPPFAAVELAGTNVVVIRVGAPQSVEVIGDDNLVDRITTTVTDGRLVIGDTGSYTTTSPMSVAVSVPTIDGVELSGAGAVTVEGVTAAAFDAQLAGAGTIVVSGEARLVHADLTGDGTLDLHELSAVDGTARLGGTGTIRINATATLDATLSGTGTILYRGDPAVTMEDTGTGSVVPEQ
jgi:hypothetical protein